MAACNTMLAALHYGRLGLSVLPVWHPSGNACACPQGKDCHSPAKHPLLAEWQKKASTDTDVILEWWKRWPSANVGVVLGPHRLLVDADKDKGGLSTLAELERAHGPLSEEWSAVSGGGGRHHVLALPADKNVKSRAERLGAGLDIRSGDAYFLVAPSQHVSGGRYNWLHRPMEGEPPPAPPWLLELLDQASSAPSREQQPERHVGDPGKRTPKGQRHLALVRFARRVRAACKTYEEFEAALIGWGAEQCDPPISREEAIRQARDLFDRFAPNTGSIILTNAADINPEPITWLWPGRIARGKLSLLAGHPGVGKSQLALGMAATLSRGWNWPDGAPGCFGDTLILSAEDDPADTIIPRLMANGANLDLVHVVDGVRAGYTPQGREVRRELCLADDIDKLSAALEGIPNAALVVIDPLGAFLGDADSHRDASVRGLLTPLATLASDHRVAVLAIAHLNKAAHTEALSRITGSIAFTAAARSAWLVGKDPDDDARRLFVPLKNNLGSDQTGLAFELKPTSVSTSAGELPTSALRWFHEEIATNAAEVLAAGGAAGRGEALKGAESFLSELLAEGPLPSSEVRREAAETRISWRTLTRAKDNLGVIASRDKFGSGGRWFWTLPKGANSPKEANNENLASLAKNGPFPLKNAKDAKTTEWAPLEGRLASLGDPTGPESDQGRPESGGWDDLEI